MMRETTGEADTPGWPAVETATGPASPYGVWADDGEGSYVSMGENNDKVYYTSPAFGTQRVPRPPALNSDTVPWARAVAQSFSNLTAQRGAGNFMDTDVASGACALLEDVCPNGWVEGGDYALSRTGGYAAMAAVGAPVGIGMAVAGAGKDGAKRVRSNAPRDRHATLRETQRDIDVDAVMKNGTKYFGAEDDGSLKRVRVLDVGSGNYHAVIQVRQMSGEYVTKTTMKINQNYLQKRLDSGEWF